MYSLFLFIILHFAQANDECTAIKPNAILTHEQVSKVQDYKIKTIDPTPTRPNGSVVESFSIKNIGPVQIKIEGCHTRSVSYLFTLKIKKNYDTFDNKQWVKKALKIIEEMKTIGISVAGKKTLETYLIDPKNFQISKKKDRFYLEHSDEFGYQHFILEVQKKAAKTVLLNLSESLNL